jgi:hypothetical protein
MRKDLPVLGLALLCSIAANAQKIVLMPQVGLQTFYNDVSNVSYFQRYNKNTALSPTIGARLLYLSQKGHGPFVGYYVGDLSVWSYDGTVHSGVGISLRRYEAGYQWMTRPVYFKQLWNNGLNKLQLENLPAKGLGLQLQPSLGLFYTKTTTLGADSYSINNTVYNGFLYRPNFGINAGLGFAFVNNNRSIFTLSVNYTKGFGKLYSSDFSNGNSPSNSYLSTNGSGWHFSFGVPISLFHKK